MTTQELVDALRNERARAQSIVDGCDQALAVFVPMLPFESSKARVDRIVSRYGANKTKRGPKAGSRKPKAVAPTSGPEAAPESKVGQCRTAILAYLRRHDSSGMADSTVLRRECAKVCGKDLKNGDVSNALSWLKRAGHVERSGDVWAITDAGRVAA